MLKEFNNALCMNCKMKMINAYKNSKDVKETARQLNTFCPKCLAVCRKYKEDLKALDDLAINIS